jgi:hypothetical protein
MKQWLIEREDFLKNIFLKKPNMKECKYGGTACTQSTPSENNGEGCVLADIIKYSAKHGRMSHDGIGEPLAPDNMRGLIEKTKGKNIFKYCEQDKILQAAIDAVNKQYGFEINPKPKDKEKPPSEKPE